MTIKKESNGLDRDNKVERAERPGHGKHGSDHSLPIFKSVRTYWSRLGGL